MRSSGTEEKLVNGVEEAPGALGIYGDVTVQFAGGGEGVALSDGEGIFEPVPVCGLVGIENESCFAVGVIGVPVRVAESLVDAVSVEGAHEGLNTHAAGRSIIGRPGPGGEPAAVVELGKDCEVGDDAGAEIADGTGEDFGDDGVVDVDVDGRLAVHGRWLHRFKGNDTHLEVGIASC